MEVGKQHTYVILAVTIDLNTNIADKMTCLHFQLKRK